MHTGACILVVTFVYMDLHIHSYVATTTNTLHMAECGAILKFKLAVYAIIECLVVLIEYILMNGNNI